ncbi:hypothetical protein AB0G73_22190 [Streptomyces sp. NPDC020719]|uniref:hypothetical protein n=1 Tax=Streptomyces sp. NPDC020719 TaxID=3154896 RepID=UPI0033CE88F7
MGTPSEPPCTTTPIRGAPKVLHLLYALRVSHPHILITIDQQDSQRHVYLRDQTGRTAHAEPAAGAEVQIPGDGADLRADLRSGYQLWRERGRPEPWDFGMTITPLAQTVWVDSPETGPCTG